MKGLISCLITIVCLSLISAAPADEGEVKTHFKIFNFENKTVQHSFYPFWDDQYVYAVCEGSDSEEENKCKVYLVSSDQDDNTIQSCDLNLKYKGNYHRSHVLFNAGNSRAVFAARASDTTMKLINVNFKGCHVKEIIIDVPKLSAMYTSGLYQNKVFIIPHENNYDLFFQNQELCHGFICKAVYDYEGKVVKAVSPFPVKVWRRSWFRMMSINNVDLIARSVDYIDIDVYLVKDEDGSIITTLHNSSVAVPYVGLSIEENKFGSCAYFSKTIVCKQYEADGKTKIVEVEIPFDWKRAFPYLDMYNLEKGFLLMTVEYNNDNTSDLNRTALISVSHFDEQGKSGKSIKVDTQCKFGNLLLGKLYKNTNGQFCVNAICAAVFEYDSSSRDSQIDRTKFSHTSRCFLRTELF